MIPGLGRSSGEGIGYPLESSRGSLVAQGRLDKAYVLYRYHIDVVKNPPAMQETWVPSQGWEDPRRRAWQPTPVFSPREYLWTEVPGGLWSMGSQTVRHD